MTKTLEPYLSIARSTGIFCPKEIELITNILEECRHSKGYEHVLVDERIAGTIVGFAVFGHIEWTKSSWELYWIVVERSYQRKGIGRRLLGSVEDYIGSKTKDPILVAEVSSLKEYDPAHSFCIRTGFKKAGMIPNLFDEGDHLITYYKHICS